MNEALERISTSPDDDAHALRWLAMDALRARLEAGDAALLRIAAAADDVSADQLKMMARAALGEKE